jgi:hypothetical protein
LGIADDLYCAHWLNYKIQWNAKKIIAIIAILLQLNRVIGGGDTETCVSKGIEAHPKCHQAALKLNFQAFWDCQIRHLEGSAKILFYLLPWFSLRRRRRPNWPFGT